jgi:hypothetical protein
MERWNSRARCKIENSKIDAFLAEVIEVSKKHNLSIGHEDLQGSFVVEKLKESNLVWLMAANDWTDD